MDISLTKLPWYGQIGAFLVVCARVASEEDTAAAQPRYLPVMDAKIAAPVQGVRLEPLWRALTEYLLHEV